MMKPSVIHRRKSLVFLLSCLFLSCLLLSGCQPGGQSGQAFVGEVSAVSPYGSSGTAVHFIDVGQGLSVLIQSDGHSMLYDGGDRGASSLVVAYLEDQGVESLDYVVASHYDSDHLNGVVGALNVFPVGEVLAPDYETDTRVYQSFCRVIEEQSIPLTHPLPGDTYDLGNASFTVLAPQDRAYSDANDYSVAIRLEVGEVSFLITGDAESGSEEEMIRTGLPLESTVYVAGHHGSGSSGSWDFLRQAVPQYAVISCGTGNSYGHPHAETMEKFEAMEIQVFRTDLQGTVTAYTDGSSLTWSQEACDDYTPGDPDDKPARTQAQAQDQAQSQDLAQTQGQTQTQTQTQGQVPSQAQTAPRTYLLNTKSKLIHRPDCSSVADMEEKNKAQWTGQSLEDCLAEYPDYRGCKRCSPE